MSTLLPPVGMERLAAVRETAARLQEGMEDLQGEAADDGGLCRAVVSSDRLEVLEISPELFQELNYNTTAVSLYLADMIGLARLSLTHRRNELLKERLAARKEDR